MSLPARIVLASHNRGKLAEFSSLLPESVTLVSAGDLNLPEPEETGNSFAANAILKAMAAAQASGMTALADDSGLVVTALNNAPGIYSARWAGDAPGNYKDFTKAMQRVHQELGDTPDRSAAFVCVLALATPDGEITLAEGICTGDIIWPPRGTNGFGYDPIFVATGETSSFGEMTKAEKAALSHRAKAVTALLEKLGISA